MQQFSLHDFEQALDQGILEVPVNSGYILRPQRYWRIRRNGKTRTWKRDAERWEIPCKAGLKLCFTVSNTEQYGIRVRAAD
jgi:hypothetical protein